MAEFNSSNYPDIKKASDVYSIAKSEFQKLDRQLDETPTTSKNYKDLVERRNAAQEKMNKALESYQSITKKRKADFDAEQKRKSNIKKSKSLKAKLKSLEDSRQRAKDKGEATTAIDTAISKAEEDLAKIAKGDVSKDSDGEKEVTRPASVPAGAKFNTVTGQWTLGNKNWDKNGKAIGTKTKVDSADDGADDGVSDGKYSGTGTFDNPLTINDKRFSGTYKNKKYENGILLPEKPDKDTNAYQGAGTEEAPFLQNGKPFTGTYQGKTYKDGLSVISEDVPEGFDVTEVDFNKVLAQAQAVFGGIDEIFKTNEELRKLLIAAVGDPNVVADEYTVARFVSELENTKWFKTNAGPIRQRGFYERQYNELNKGLKMDDPDYKNKLAELDRTSEWGRGLQDTIETVNEYVTQLIGVGALDDMTIRAIASEIYKYANEDDAVKIRNAVLGAARYGIGKVIGGQAGEALSSLKSIASANGFDLEKQFATDLPTWLDRINKGESLETYKKIIRDSAKTAFGVSDRISALMDQGVNLDTIYSPYKNVMASVLELNPQTITLKDLSDKGVFGAKQEMNLYDFQKVIRKDPRWQMTQNARDEMSQTALTLLRNFGFQG